MTKRCTNLIEARSADAQSAQPLHSERITRAQRLTHEESMNLVPIRPPGPAIRKARAFAVDILRLRSQGYTFEAIREALAAVGVHVSNSTVQREVARAGRQPPVASSSVILARDQAPALQGSIVRDSAPTMGSAAPMPAPTLPARGVGSPSNFANGPSGEEVAKAFMATQITNPFMREKEQQ